LTESRPGVVSVVMVNFRGSQDTLEALEALSRVAWPSDLLEIIVVDNGSGDGSVGRLRRAAPTAIVIDVGENIGFAAGCNRGVARATGEFIAFLNNDAKPDGAWISTAISAFEDPEIGAVASKVLDGEGHKVDFIDAALTWYGKGYKPFVGETAGTLGGRPKDVLFGTGSGMFVRAATFLRLGGFDEKFFMFYEDVDFGWRLNLAGERFRYIPESVVFHKHHGTVAKFGSFRESYLLDRNALFTLYKNLEQSRLDSVLPSALAFTIHRAVTQEGVDSTVFDFRRLNTDDAEPQVVSKNFLASIFAVDQFVAYLPELSKARAEVQATRRRSDRALWSLFGRVDALPASDESYVGYEKLINAFDVTTRPAGARVLVITGDPVGARMAGPAIRAWNIAENLSSEHTVTLATLSNLELMDAPFALRRLRAGDERSFRMLERESDVIIFQGHAMSAFQSLRDTEKVVIADVYDPMHLEQLEQGRDLPAATWDKQVADATNVLNEQLAAADFILCASERQRTFYLGQLAALGRLNPATYHGDPNFSGLIAAAPFGFTAIRPRHEREVLRGVVKGIAETDKVIIWGGGLYNWFDPQTLIRAMAVLSERHPSARLFFLGTKHPHPGVPEMAVVAESRSLAADLGLLNSSVFFNDSWVPYSDRQNYLTESDAGVSTHFSHIETTFSFRTRILDYLWASIPMVVTEGDTFADLVAQEGLGVVVPAQDVDALADALARVLFDTDFAAKCRANIERIRERYLWSETLRPLAAFMKEPRRAADRVEARLALGGLLNPGRVKAPRRRGFRYDLGLVGHYLRNGGPLVVARKVLLRLRSR